jgi:DNA polymerase III subunit epsilon
MSTFILVYDTETNGLTKPQLPVGHPEQPHLVQLGALLLTDTGKEVSSVDLIVRPDNWTIPDVAAKVHGITTGIAKEVGVPLATVLSAFAQLRAIAGEIVAYNIDFDDLVMRAAFHRLGKAPSHPGPDKRTCCMTLASPIVNLPPTDRMRAAGFTKNKPPNLTEAYQFFFGKPFKGDAHAAIHDCRAAAEILFEIRRREATDKIPF